MRIKSLRLENYKRFTELTIADVPETARLVVLVGPNGTGKVLGLRLVPAEGQGGRQQLPASLGTRRSTTTRFRSPRTPIRSRVESASSSTASVRVTSTGNPPSRCGRRTGTRRTSASRTYARRVRGDAEPHIARIIDRDESVSKNYERTVWKRLQDLDRDAPRGSHDRSVPERIPRRLAEGHERPLFGPESLAAGLRAESKAVHSGSPRAT